MNVSVMTAKRRSFYFGLTNRGKEPNTYLRKLGFTFIKYYFVGYVFIVCLCYPFLFPISSLIPDSDGQSSSFLHPDLTTIPTSHLYSYTENGSSRFHQNLGNYLHGYIVSQPRRPQFKLSQVIQHEINTYIRL